MLPCILRPVRGQMKIPVRSAASAASQGRYPSQPAAEYARIGVVFLAYFVAGKIGLAAPFTSGNVSPVWPASGVALAAVLLYGYRVWPAIAAASFLVNFLSPIPHIAAVGLAGGNTLAALTGAFLLRRIPDFCISLSRLRDVLGLIVFAGLGSTMVSASIGVAVLFATHVRPWSAVGSAWLMYWLGDAMGVLFVTPVVGAFPDLSRVVGKARLMELAVLLMLLAIACLAIFGDRPFFTIKLHVLAFAVFPFVIWAAIRFGVAGCALANLLIAGIATAETVTGSGPFAQNTGFMNAALLQVYFAVLSVSGLILAAVVVERERAESERQRLAREQLLRAARLRLAAIVESSDDAIIGKGVDGTITDWNKGAERIYGYTAEQVIGKPVSILIPPERPDEIPQMMERIKRGERIEHYETIRVTKAGQRIQVSLTMSPIRDEVGNITGASAAGRDITERKRAEEERERLLTELQGALAKVKLLSGFLPICAACKKIRNDEGYWEQVETYIRHHSDVEFSHGLCPDCLDKFSENSKPE